MMWFIIHTVRLDIITTIDQHRRDTITTTDRRDTITIITTDRRHLIITISIMAITINLDSSIDLIAISRSDRLRRSVIINLPQREDADKKYNEIKK